MKDLTKEDLLKSINENTQGLSYHHLMIVEKFIKGLSEKGDK